MMFLFILAPRIGVFTVLLLIILIIIYIWYEAYVDLLSINIMALAIIAPPGIKAPPGIRLTSTNSQVRSFVSIALQFVDGDVTTEKAQGMAAEFSGDGQRAFDIGEEGWEKTFRSATWSINIRTTCTKIVCVDVSSVVLILKISNNNNFLERYNLA